MEVKYYTCDRCGKRIENTDAHYNVSIYRDVQVSYVNSTREFYDLCEACKADYDEWINHHGTH